jgi:hypothetical protein
LLAAVALPAFGAKLFAVTPSGSTELLFPNEPTAAIGKLSSTCIDARWTISSSTSNELVCEVPMSFGQEFLGQLLLGNSYSTQPREFVRFNVAEINGVSRVQASGWIELQMAFGQIRRTALSGPDLQNNMTIFMLKAGGKFPPGTTFPNHVAMGIQNAGVPLPTGIGLKITSFDPGSAAEQAGLKIGDVITGIAGRHFKNALQVLDAEAKATESDAYPVEFLRDGQRMTLTLNRAFRPTVTQAVVRSPPAEPALATSPLGSMDPADELAKLAKLRDQGIITPEEFAAQKKKLLGN